MRGKSVFKEPGVALRYNPEVTYNEDPVFNIAGLTVECKLCKVLKFPGETEGMCCSNGKVKLQPLPELPAVLKELLDGNTRDSKKFRPHIRASYNNAFAMSAASLDLKESNADNTNGIADLPSFHGDDQGRPN